MLNTRPRRSTSAVSYTETEANSIQSHLNQLRRLLNDDPPQKTYQLLQLSIEHFHLIRQSFFENANPNRIRDAFRNLDGFQILLNLLRKSSTLLVQKDSTVEEQKTVLDFIHSVLGTLCTALQNHWGNRKYFRKRVENGGWITINTILKTLIEAHRKSGHDTKDVQERLFGYLLACGLEDEALNDLFSKLGRSICQYRERGTGDNVTTVAEQTIQTDLGSQTFLHNPDTLLILLDLWIGAIGSPQRSSDAILCHLPTVFRLVLRSSTHNLVAAHEAGLLSRILPLFLNASLSPQLANEFQHLTVTLLNLGVTNLDDAYFLYKNAASSSIIAETLHRTLKEPFTPPFIHFDLSLHGYASVELPDLGRTFPPNSSSPGYTFAAWFQVINFDSDSHTTIFGAFDSSQTCFVLVYLEKDTRNLILQTSVTSSRPSVRFKTFVFEPAKWYHLCIVHRRPKTTSSSRASLFVNGEFVEQVKAHYPAAPPVNSGSSPANLLSVGQKHKAVQAFLGTPQDLATRLGHGAVKSQWRLASAYLLSDALSDDLIAVHKELGPRYHGNYQDCLGSFQTYEASAALNLRNENLHPGKEEKSDIVAAIRSRASELLPETKYLLNVSPMMILDDDDRNNVDETQLMRFVSKTASKNMRHATRGGRSAIVINGAIPSINEALLHACGFALLTGNPAVTVPWALDDVTWCIGGCGPIGLTLVESAQTHEEIIRALEILCATVKYSWRNSEAMERENGFGVLASLLAEKISLAGDDPVANESLEDVETEQDMLAYSILLTILEFVGYNVQSPENSIINNPLAYRVLLVDLDIWRTMSTPVQKLYYEQFTTFSVGSKHHLFNAKRLARMRITKKWLEALKGDTYYADTLEYFIHAFQSLLGNSVSADSHRSLALYITYAVHKAKGNKSPLPRPTKSVRKPPQFANTITRRSTAPLLSSNNGDVRSGNSKALTQLEVGMKILEMYTSLLCQKDTLNIKKFARTVTNKWLLHLLVDDDPTIVGLSAKILARVLIANGASYVEKFAEKTGGFIIMRYRLRRWWNITTLWPICFAILFGQDVTAIDFERNFDLFSLISSFPPKDMMAVFPGVFPVIVGMLQNGLKTVIRDQQDPNSPRDSPITPQREGKFSRQAPKSHGRSRSMSLQAEVDLLNSDIPRKERLSESIHTIQTVTKFLADLHTNSPGFREFAFNSTYVQELLFLLFPIVVSSDVVSPETELHSRDSALTFNGSDVIIRPLSQASQKPTSIVRTVSVEGVPSPNTTRAQPLKRGSSYILITAEQSNYQPSSAKLEAIGSPKKDKARISLSTGNTLVEEILEIIITVFSDQIFSRKEFAGTGLFMKVPPGFQEHQAYFESFILRNTISSLSNMIKLNQKLVWETRVITNLGRFCGHLDEAVYEGWFIDGGDVVLDFIGEQLEYLQRPDIKQLKTVRLCSEIVSSMRTVISRIALLKMSEVDESLHETDTVTLLNKFIYWQTVLFVPEASQEEFLKLFCYLLYTKLVSSNETVREAAANLWRILLVQKLDETSSVLQRLITTEDNHLSKGFQKVLELDNSMFLDWVEDHRPELDAIFFGKLASSWENFVSTENRLTQESYKARMIKRREKLKTWVTDDMVRDDIIRRHEINSDHWRSNIFASENLKRQRGLQDQQDGLNFNMSTWAEMIRRLKRPCGLLDSHEPQKWKLDLTEGRNRMRLRLIPDLDAHTYDYKSKLSSSKAVKKNQFTVDVRTKSLSQENLPIAPSPTSTAFKRVQSFNKDDPQTDSTDAKVEGEDDFEMVEDPGSAEIKNFEDKNRKVMRSLQRGDQVEHVHNISRIAGLEACEGLLIVGKSALYLLDNFFQRSDGEIVDVWQAPVDERDSYMQMISGREAGTGTSKPSGDITHETRSWRWEDMLSISKRRFLFRDVAIEMFFVDGQSYLLTIATPKLRDELYQKLISKAQSAASGSMSVEDQWRIDSLKNPEDNPQTLGSRFTSVFNQGAATPATKKWIKGEISNFHYLMIVNTMAGRTFNDLTQYPVFPWVLADYTSEELDLTNPQSFRDLSKPMGCQTMERQSEFRDRYQSFAEMGDHNAPPFHYGTHYSSAMIVTSFLIRLQPFVQSYLLLQGGSFDHPDRLFYSMERAWTSASRDNMTDVRELIPEFYYLPEFFTNANGYDFGTRQGDGGRIDNVALPPWAKGDPKVFIAKHREALESEYVSKHLHQWIDLVFGHKQRGEAALEATNVFHHLSYRGAKNLDEIDDPMERLATIGIIHNFGQTPHQVFQRSHPAREDPRQHTKNLDTLADTLTRLPFPLLESSDQISHLSFSRKADRLLCSGPFRIHMPPVYDKYIEWGYVDGSVRFYTAEAHKPIGLFEHMHQGQLSAALFADSRTLITAGTDCTIAIWGVVSHSSKPVELVPKGSIFGHRAPVNVLAVSRAFSTVLSASTDGRVLLWDLNKLDLVRVVGDGRPVQCASVNDVTGTILLCRGPTVSLFTLNGELLLEQHICVEGDELITSCAFYEGMGNEFLARELILTGHKRGVVDVWNLTIRDGKFVLEHVKRMNHMDSAGFNVNSAITAILPIAQVVYTGDDDGRVYEWDCIQRQEER